jgi:hypothetical protein
MYVPIKLMEQQFPVVPMTILMVEIRRRRAPACCGGTPPALPLLLCPCVPTKQNGKQGSEQRHRQGGHWAVLCVCSFMMSAMAIRVHVNPQPGRVFFSFSELGFMLLSHLTEPVVLQSRRHFFLID